MERKVTIKVAEGPLLFGNYYENLSSWERELLDGFPCCKICCGCAATLRSLVYNQTKKLLIFHLYSRFRVRVLRTFS